MRRLVIGDIHGCLTALKTVMAVAAPTARDELVFLGDYVDRGPDSRGVLEWILGAKDRWKVITLKGNHEVMMLEARMNPKRPIFWTTYGGRQTLASYGVTPTSSWAGSIPDRHWDFLAGTELYYETGHHIFVHGMAVHDRPMSEQPEETLLWGRCTEMKPHQSGKVVICGHTPQESGSPERYPFGYCVDTGVYMEGWLTCMDVGTGEYWQANEAGESRTGRLEV